VVNTGFESEAPPSGGASCNWSAIFWELEELMPFSSKPWWRWGFRRLGAPKISLLKGTMTEGVRWKLVHKHLAAPEA